MLKSNISTKEYKFLASKEKIFKSHLFSYWIVPCQLQIRLLHTSEEEKLKLFQSSFSLQWLWSVRMIKLLFSLTLESSEKPWIYYISTLRCDSSEAFGRNEFLEECHNFEINSPTYSDSNAPRKFKHFFANKSNSATKVPNYIIFLAVDQNTSYLMNLVGPLE